MSLCQGCGASYGDSFKFCPHCGRSKPAPQTANVSVEIRPSKFEEATLKLQLTQSEELSEAPFHWRPGILDRLFGDGRAGIRSSGKITGYLLSEEESSSKTDYFVRLGFSPAQWRQLESVLLSHAVTNEVKQVIRNQHGTKYVIEGALQTLDDRNSCVLSVWIIEHQQEGAHLVTAYPLEE